MVTAAVLRFALFTALAAFLISIAPTARAEPALEEASARKSGQSRN